MELMECSLVGWLTLVVLAATGAVIAWYTVETYRLRREAQLQTELQSRPFLSITIDGAGSERRARLVNLGRGVARNISVDDIVIDRSMQLRGHRELTHLASGDTSLLPFHVWVSVGPDDPISEVPMEDHGWNVANALDSNDVTLMVNYASLTGQPYETTIRMIKGVPRIVDDRRASMPSDNPGRADRPIVGHQGMSQDTLRATFATIAQTLAAVLAILIAIVVIRLPAIEHDVAMAKLHMRAFPPFATDYEKASRAFLSRGVDGLRDAGFEVDRDWPNRGIYLEAGYRAWTAWGRLIPSVWIALGATFLVIGFCLVALPNVEHFRRYQWASKAVWFVIALAIGCLIAYVSVLLGLLGRRAF